MRGLTLITAFLALLLGAAIFGFFYAWICSTMWGLDAADPRVAIAAMQAMNASVRNWVFFPAFFATPFVMLAAAVLLWRRAQHPSALAFAAGGGLYLAGGMLLTLVVNVPMNEALAGVAVPEDPAAAQVVWEAYSPRWQVWNLVRTGVSGLACLLAAAGLYLIDRRTV